MVRRVVGARAEPHEPRLRRVAGLLVAEHLDRLIGQILREVIALLRAVGLLDEPVVLDEVGVPLVGLAAEESVEAVEALLERPLPCGWRPRRCPARGRCGSCRARTCSSRRPGGSARSSRTRPGSGRSQPGKPLRAFGDAGHAVEVMVAPGQERGARRRAERGRVPLRVDQARCRRASAASAC